RRRGGTGRPLVVGSPSASAPAAARVRRPAGDGADGTCGQDEARTFFVAMVASATITTRSNSFFMASSVAATSQRPNPATAPGGGQSRI
ncbi:MAG TPA: hypothetical protein VGJ43_11235, partial [Acidimicrobiales bacterium]